MVSTLQALSDRHDRMNDLVAAGEVIDLRFTSGGRTLSTPASKLFHLLVQHAGPAIQEPREHRVKVAHLLGHGLRHMRLDELVECLHELVGSVISVEVLDGDRPHTKVGSFLANLERDHDADTGELIYEFSKALRYVFARSSYWVVLDRRATMAFESRYAIRLYELIALRGGLDRKTTETFALDDLRRRFGVPDGKLGRWQDLKRKVLDTAVAEVNHVSPFVVSWAPIKNGRSVAAVSLTWKRKEAPERAAALKEVSRSRVGRKGRRASGAELVEVPPTFPDGPIRYTRWADLVRKHAPSPTPDVDLVADRFRAFCRGRQLPLNAATIERAFVGYCQRFQVR